MEMNGRVVAPTDGSGGTMADRRFFEMPAATVIWQARRLDVRTMQQNGASSSIPNADRRANHDGGITFVGDLDRPSRLRYATGRSCGRRARTSVQGFPSPSRWRQAIYRRPSGLAAVAASVPRAIEPMCVIRERQRLYVFALPDGRTNMRCSTFSPEGGEASVASRRGQSRTAVIASITRRERQHVRGI